MNVEGLSYAVGTHSILQGITFTTPDGRGIRIRGKTGVGKSTLAQILSRRIPVLLPGSFQPFSRSWRYVNGKCTVSQFDVPFPAAYLPSDPFDVLIYPSVRDCFPLGASQAQISSVLEAVGLSTAVVDQDLWQLSGGMLQRIALARAALLKSHLLITDQLHEWLDESGRHMLANMMAEHVHEGGIAVAIESTASPPAADFPVLRLENERLYPISGGEPAEWRELAAKTAPGNRPALEVSNVSKIYHTGARTNVVLNNIKLLIREGEWVGIRGANGAGKSVLARLIAGLEDVTPGTYKIFGQQASITDRIREVAYLFQIPSQLLPFPTVRDLVKRIAPAADRNGVTLHLEDLGISKSRRVSDLTPAAQRLVGLELLMVKKPKIVILDEPTWGADAEEVLGFIGYVRNRLTWPHAVILISHDAGLIAMQCHRALTVINGKLLED
jgi:energy-coupling factor transport system ATP-binding protein